MNTRGIILGSEIIVPEPVLAWAESLKDQAGVHTCAYQGKYVYLIAAGERPTGGFRVVIQTADAEKSAVLFHVAGPSPDDFVIQVITYPYEIILSDSPLNFVRCPLR